MALSIRLSSARRSAVRSAANQRQVGWDVESISNSALGELALELAERVVDELRGASGSNG